MELFKMMNQIFTHDEKYSDRKNYFINLFLNKGVTENNTAQGNNKQIKTKKSIDVSHKLKSCRVLFASSGDKLEVLIDNNKTSIKLKDISFPNKYSDKSKEANKTLNDFFSKKTAYYEIVDGEYVIYKHPNDVESVNKFLIDNNLNSDNSIKQAETIIKETENVASVANEEKKTENKSKEVSYTGTVDKYGIDNYMFDKNKSKSFFITIINNDENPETIWGVDLKKLVDDLNIIQGDKISIVNLGKTTVQSKTNVVVNGKTEEVTKDITKNLWNINIIEKIQSDNIVPENKVVKEENKKSNNYDRKNCFGLALENNKSITCMLDKTLQKFELYLPNVDFSIISEETNNLIKLNIANKITKKVVYLSFIDKQVEVFDSVSSEVSINKEIIDIINKSPKINIPIVDNSDDSSDNPFEDSDKPSVDLPDDINVSAEPKTSLKIGGKSVVVTGEPKKLKFGKK